MLGIAALIPCTISTVAFGESGGTDSSFKSLSKNLASIKKIHFQQQINTNFRFSVKGKDGASSKWVNAELIEVEDLMQSPGPLDEEKGIEHFSLQFKGPSNFDLNQDTYTVKHDQLGKFKLFVVPGNQNQQGLKYEAIFNRLVALD